MLPSHPSRLPTLTNDIPPAYSSVASSICAGDRGRPRRGTPSLSRSLATVPRLIRNCSVPAFDPRTAFAQALMAACWTMNPRISVPCRTGGRRHKNKHPQPRERPPLSTRMGEVTMLQLCRRSAERHRTGRMVLSTKEPGALFGAQGTTPMT